MKSLSRQARVLLKMSFVTTFAESMLVPMYAAFTERVGGSILDAGIAFAAFSIATGIAVGLIGTRTWFQQHIRGFLVLGFALSAACDFSYMLVANRWQPMWATRSIQPRRTQKATGSASPAVISPRVPHDSCSRPDATS